MPRPRRARNEPPGAGAAALLTGRGQAMARSQPSAGGAGESGGPGMTHTAESGLTGLLRLAGIRLTGSPRHAGNAVARRRPLPPPGSSRPHYAVEAIQHAQTKEEG
jgi:hypothetical protein